jgi:hypothetical protein
LAQGLEHLPSKPKSLSSNRSTSYFKNRKRKLGAVHHHTQKPPLPSPSPMGLHFSASIFGFHASTGHPTELSGPGSASPQDASVAGTMT